MDPSLTINAFNLCFSILIKESELYDDACFSEKHFKLTDTRDTNFDIVENRLAYTYKFGCYNILFAEKCISNFLSECSQADSLFPFENLKVCSLSNGPGLDIVGLLCALCKTNKSLKGFPQLNAVNLYKNWLFIFKTIVQSAYEVTSLKSFIQYFHIPARNIQLIQGDVYSTLFPEARNSIEEANVLLMFKVFASTKASSDIFSKTLKEIFSLLKPGCLIFFIGSKNNTKLFSKESDLGQYVKCIYGPQKVTLNEISIDEDIASKIGAKPEVSGSAYFIVWQKRYALVEPKVSKKKRSRRKKKTCENVVEEKDDADFVVGDDKDHDSDAGSEISFTSDSKKSDSLSDETKSDTNSSVSNSASFKVMEVTNLQNKQDLSSEVAYSVSVSSPVSRTDLKDSICKQKEPQDLLFNSNLSNECKEDYSLKSTPEIKFRFKVSEALSLAHPCFETFYETHFEARNKLDIEISKLLDDTASTECTSFNSTNPDKFAVSPIQKETNSFYKSTDSDESFKSVDSDSLAPAVEENLKKATANSFKKEIEIESSHNSANPDTIIGIKMNETDSVFSSTNPGESTVAAQSYLLAGAINENFEEVVEKAIEEEAINSFFDPYNSDPVIDFKLEKPAHSFFDFTMTIPDICAAPAMKKEEKSSFFNAANLDSPISDKVSLSDCRSEKLIDLQQNCFNLSIDNVLGAVSHLEERKLETSTSEDKTPKKFYYSRSLHEICDKTQSVSSEKSSNTQPQTKKEIFLKEKDSSQTTADVACNTVKTSHNEKLKTSIIESNIQDPDKRQVHNFYKDIYEKNVIEEKIQTNKVPLVMEKSIQENETNLNFPKVNSVGKILQSPICSKSKQNIDLKTGENSCSKNSEENKLQYVVKTKCVPSEMSGASKRENTKSQDKASLPKCVSSKNQSSRNLLNKSEKNVKSPSEIYTQTMYDTSRPDTHLLLQRCDNLITSLEKLTGDIKNSISSSSKRAVNCCCSKEICGNVQGSPNVRSINNHCCHHTSCGGTCRNNITLGSRLATERAGPYIVIPLQNEDLMQILTSRKS